MSALNFKHTTMGKGDRKSKKGKIFMGSYGNTRRKKKKIRKFVVQKVTDKSLVLPEVAMPASKGQETSVAEVAKPKVKRAAPKKKTEGKKESKPASKKTAKKSGE